jgi:hypothetical protein
MKKKYLPKYLQLMCVLLITVVVSCKKYKTKNKTNAAATSIGLFEYKDSVDANDVYYRIYIPLTKIGNQTVNYDEVFDTGSAGLTLGAKGIVPPTMYSKTNGFTITGDSVVVAGTGITITSKTAVMEYGDAISGTNVYGNVAYASITIGDPSTGSVAIKRVPFFLYYKVLDLNNGTSTPDPDTSGHGADIFGVSPEYSYASTLIQSPLSYYTPGTGLTNGFKIAKLIKTDFINLQGVYEQSLLTIGLTIADLNSSGFIMHNYSSSYNNTDGYSPDIPGTITYLDPNTNATNTVSATFLFDTGNPQLSIIEDPTAKTTNFIGTLPVGTPITLKTQDGFSYSYTTAKTTNLTEVNTPLNTHDYRTIFSLEFFTDNEFLTNYTGHEIGLKNN